MTSLPHKVERLEKKKKKDAFVLSVEPVIIGTTGKYLIGFQLAKQ